MAHRSWLLVLLGIAALAACSEDENDSEENGVDAPTSWQGQAHHAIIVGEVLGEPISVDLGDDAADVDRAACKREYRVPDPADLESFDDGVLREVELNLNIVIDGVEKKIALSLESGDLRP